MGRLYQLIGIFCVLSVFWYGWKQCAGLKFRRAIPIALFVTFLFITIYYKNISNPLVAYFAIGVIGIPAVIYGLLYRYEILLIIAAIYIPHNAILPADFGGIQKALNGTNIVLVALILGMFTSKLKGKISLHKKPATILMVILILTVGISFIRGGLFHGSGYMRGMIFDFKRFITPLILFLIFARTIPDKGTIKVLFSILLIVIIMAIFLGLLEWVNLGFGAYSEFKRRLGGLNKQPNAFGAFIAYYICLILAQFLTNFRKFEGKLLVAPFLLGLRLLLPTNSRGAWLSLPPALLTVSFMRSKLLLIVVIVGLFVPFMFVPGLMPDVVKHRFQEAAEREQMAQIYHHTGGITGYFAESKAISMRVRYILIEGGLKLWRENIFWGHGYGVFIHLIQNYTEGGLRGSAHNFYLQAICEMGVIPLIVLLAILLHFFISAIYVYKREKDPMLKGFALGYMGCIPALIVANLTGDRFNHVDLTAIFWMLSAAIIKLRAIIKTENFAAG